MDTYAILPLHKFRQGVIQLISRFATVSILMFLGWHRKILNLVLNVLASLRNVERIHLRQPAKPPRHITTKIPTQSPNPTHPELKSIGVRVLLVPGMTVVCPIVFGEA